MHINTMHFFHQSQINRVAISNKQKRNDVIQMRHEIDCVQNAIHCAIENNEHATYTTIELYEIANMYIDEQIVTCVCEYVIASRIEIELRELYKFANANVSIKSRYVESLNMFHVICDIHYYNENEHQMFAMICDVNDVNEYNSSFTTFKMIDEIEIN